MGSLYLTDMADWFRAAGGNVVEYDGWKTRSRSSGGYESGRPWGVMWHHTASSTSPENDANYMCHGSSDRPIANLLIARDGAIWVLAAGATNTNGKGSGVVWSRGRVPDDSMNTYAVGMEIACDGVGGAYSQAQIDGAFLASVTLVQRLGLAPTDVAEHFSWAPDRKIDPATATAVEGPWQPSSCTSSGTWELGDLIAEHQRRCGAEPGPTPGPSNERRNSMADFVVVYGEDPFPDGAVYEIVNGRKRWVDPDEWAEVLKGVVMDAAGGVPDHQPWQPVAFVANGWALNGLPDWAP
jgi:N-acetylmuramoyl-L-alanine amidase